MQLTLSVLEEPLAVCRLPADASVPPSILDSSFCAVTRTKEELSIVLAEASAQNSWQIESGWRGLQVVGPLEFDIVGVVAALSAPLAAAGIPIFIISTFDTDYLLVKESALERSCRILAESGHAFTQPSKLS